MFLNNIHMTQESPDVFILTDKLTYQNDKYTIEVLRGFDFDGASIPRIFWSIIGSPMFGKHVRAACLHDALYASRLLPRDECDALFLEAMQVDDVGWLTRKLMYRAVRLAGKKAYDDGDDKPYLDLVLVLHA